MDPDSPPVASAPKADRSPHHPPRAGRGHAGRVKVSWFLWGTGLAVVITALGLGVFSAFTKVRDSSKLKSMLPRQPAAGIDQFFLEYPYRIFLKYDELVGPGRYIRNYTATDGEDLSTQFPLRRDWGEAVPVRLPDGTTVRRLDVLAAIGQSGLVAMYPLPQDGHYDPKRVYRLDCGVSFRGQRVVNLPPDPAGREGRDQDGVHTYQFPDGRRFEVTYRSGVPDGSFRAHHADGTLWGEATYRNGRVVTAWLITRDGHRFDELKNGDIAGQAVANSRAASSQDPPDRGQQEPRAKD